MPFYLFPILWFVLCTFAKNYRIFFIFTLDVTVVPKPITSVVPGSYTTTELSFMPSTTDDETVAKNSSDVDQSHDSSTDTVEPVLGAGCSELYPEVERPSNPHLDESTNIASSSSSVLKDITRPGTPMPGRVSRKSSSHDPESRDIVEILQQALGPGEDRLSDTELPSDVPFNLSRTRYVLEIFHFRHEALT